MRAENARLKNSAADQAAELTDDEIRQKIIEADQNPTNFDFQKNLALGLYGYAGMKQDAKYLPDAARLLRRALESKPQDYETIVALGNIHLDLGQINKDQSAIEQSREFYRTALTIKKDDADVQNDLGLTYFFAVPPDAERAIAEYEKALQVNPKHEKALENLIRAFLSLEKTKEAGDYLNRLRETNPRNQSLPDLEAQVARGGGGGNEQ